jgi:hypothetical protein
MVYYQQGYILHRYCNHTIRATFHYCYPIKLPVGSLGWYIGLFYILDPVRHGALNN